MISLNGWCPIAKRHCKEGVLNEEAELYCALYEEGCFLVMAMESVFDLIEIPKSLHVTIDEGIVDTYEQN